ncbi:LacI family DNA-binding transcriptional regulator [Inquilinus sp. OTU3971]|uniref:LacI family DNA-binding transcriptional regulator n=1 Tax=Inquilinus sp. OTU3971 TaxID=3043855 RepID=UPI00313BD63F
MSKRATIQDVADRAGVSRAAVSKVLRNAYGLSDEMRRRVEAAMRELAYRPQMAARGLRGSTYTLGVLMSDIRNPFFPDIFDGVVARLKQTKYQPLLGVRPSADATERSLIETMLDRNLDGFVMIAPHLERDYLVETARQVPFVVIGRHDSGGGFDTVNNDDRAGAAAVVDHLVAAGHRRIGFLGLEASSAREINPARVRRESYIEAMARHELETAIVDTRWSPDSMHERGHAAEWLSRPDRPTAIFAWTDKVAIAVLAAADDLGLRVPDDLAVVGYDNSWVAALPQLSLTSVDQDAVTLGRTATDLLIDRIDGRRSEHHAVTTPQLIVRRSTDPGR